MRHKRNQKVLTGGVKRKAKRKAWWIMNVKFDRMRDAREKQFWKFIACTLALVFLLPALTFAITFLLYWWVK